MVWLILATAWIAFYHVNMVYVIFDACRHHGEEYLASNGHNKRWIRVAIFGVIIPAIMMLRCITPYSNLFCQITLSIIWVIIVAFEMYKGSHKTLQKYSAPLTTIIGIILWVLYLFAGVFNPAIILFGGLL
jgi:hypothetical protein